MASPRGEGGAQEPLRAKPGPPLHGCSAGCARHPPALPAPPPGPQLSGLLVSVSPPPSLPLPSSSSFLLCRGHNLLQTACFALGLSPDICFHFPSVETRGVVRGLRRAGEPRPAPWVFLDVNISGGVLCRLFPEPVSFLLQAQALRRPPRTWNAGEQRATSAALPPPCMPPARVCTLTDTCSLTDTHSHAHP